MQVPHRPGHSLLTAVVLLVLLPASALAHTPRAAMREALAADPRNAGLEMSAYWESMFSSDAIVVSVDGMKEAKAPVDILRVLYQFASRVEDEHRFKVVKLARKGSVRFHMQGDYLRQVGREYAAGQNPVYLMRTLPQNVYNRDGTAAFPTWEGGLIGVTGRQMEDLNTFISRWLAE